VDHPVYTYVCVCVCVCVFLLHFDLIPDANIEEMLFRLSLSKNYSQ